MSHSDYDAELERRLAITEDPGYEDAARADLPRTDILLVTIGAIVVIAAAWLWGYPA